MKIHIRSTVRRRVLALAGVSAVLAAGLAAVPAGPAFAATACRIDYSANTWIESPGVGGFTASIVVNNLGDPLNGWTLSFAYSAGQTLTPPGWSANWSQSGATITATPLDWNRSLATGGSTSIGFNGRWSGSNPNPTAFTLNGVACTGTPPPANQPPTVSLTSPTSGVSFAAGAAVPLAANASDPDGTISKVEFYVDSVLVNTDTTSPYSFSASGIASGSHSAQATAFDNASPAATATSTAVSFSVGGGGTPALIATPAAVIVPEGGTTSVNFKLNMSPSSTVTVTLTRTGDSDITISPASFTLTSSNFSTGQNVTVSAAEDADQTNGTASIAAAATGVTGVSVAATEADNDVVHVDNPYAGASGYVNPDWAASVNASASAHGGTLGTQMAKVATYPTAVWLDRIAAVVGGSGVTRTLAGHLDVAVQQDAANGAAPVVVTIVVYDLPNRDCAALASNGELLVSQDGLNKYKTQYIDPIITTLSQSKYANLRIAAVVEPDSLPNLVTNLSMAKCAEANSSGAYVQGIQYALGRLHTLANVYNYLDIAHSGWLGWSSNFGPAADLIANTIKGAPGGVSTVDGFISNTANYTPTTEPFMTANQMINGQPVRSANFYQWNDYIDEGTYATAMRGAFISRGLPSTIGMLIDTSRNGWGGSGPQGTRPTGPSTSTDLNTFVVQSKIDRRVHRGNWCNQYGGIGARPSANTGLAGFDAFVWIKPPGESDGASQAIPNDEGKSFDPMCDPTFHGSQQANGGNLTEAIPNAPLAGHWFDAAFVILVQNAFPAI